MKVVNDQGNYMSPNPMIKKEKIEEFFIGTIIIWFSSV